MEHNAKPPVFPGIRRLPGSVDVAGEPAWWIAAIVLLGIGTAIHFDARDQSLFLQANAWLPAPAAVWSALSVLGLGLSACIVVAACDRGDGRAIAALLLCFPIGSVLTHLPKLLLQSPRPLAVLPADAVHVIGVPLVSHNSMPSGHALTAFAVCAVLWLTHPLSRRWLPALLLVAAGIGWSRLTTAAHWPSDVLVGAGLGIASALPAHRLAGGLGLWSRLRPPAAQRAIAGAEILAAVGMLFYSTGYPDGWPMQAALVMLGVVSATDRWRRVQAKTASASAESPEPSPATDRTFWKAAAALVLSTALLVIVLRNADFNALRSALRLLPAWVWGTAAVGSLGTYGLRAWRLRLEWRHVATAPWVDCIRLVLAHNAALALLPMRAGEASYVWLVHRQWAVRPAEAANSLLWLRLQDAFVLLVLAVAILVPLALPWRLVCVVALAACAWSLLPSMLEWGRRRSPRIDRWAEALLHRRADASGWLLCASNWILKLLVVSTLLSALSAVEPAPAWRGALGGEIAGALPLQAPAGLGTYEAGVWTAAALSPPEAARLVAAALVVHLFWLLVLLIATLAAQLVHRPRSTAHARGR